MQIGQTTEEEGVESEIQKRAHCKSKEIESEAVLSKKVSNIKTFFPLNIEILKISFYYLIFLILKYFKSLNKYLLLHTFL